MEGASMSRSAQWSSNYDTFLNIIYATAATSCECVQLLSIHTHTHTHPKNKQQPETQGHDAPAQRRMEMETGKIEARDDGPQWPMKLLDTLKVLAEVDLPE